MKLKLASDYTIIPPVRLIYRLLLIDPNIFLLETVFTILMKSLGDNFVEKLNLTKAR